MTNNKIAIILSLILCTITLLTMADYGVTWDEGGFYFSASQSYYKWLRKPRISTIDKYWDQNHEQPPIVKLLAGYSWYIFHKKLGLKNIISFRISVLLFNFILLYILFCFSARLLNKWLALLVVIAFFTLPRIFFDSHLVAMDYPVTAMWLLCIYSYWRGIKEKKWLIYSTIFLGIALATKINAFFIYLSIFFYWLLCRDKKRLFVKSIPILIIPPIMSFVLWPWLWKDPFTRIWEYISFHKEHVFLPTYYFGKTYNNPPWHYPFLMTFFTVPLVVLIPFFIGIFCVFSKHFRKEKLWVLFNALLPLVLLSFPNMPRYDGVRLFLPALPFICIIYGIGMSLLINRFKWKKTFFSIYISLFIISIYNGLITYHPYQVSYYNELVGGIDGALKKGFEIDYWGSSYKGILDWLNTERKCRIYVFEDPYPFSWYHEDDMLSRDIVLDTFGSSKYMVLLVRQGFFNEEAWDFFLNKVPMYSVNIRGVPLVCVYQINNEKI